MKGFLVLLVFSAAGLAGVLWWRQSLHAPRAPVAAAAPAKPRKERHRRHQRGARRLARNEVFASPASASAPPSPDEAPAGNDPSPAFDPVQPPSAPEERAPVAPGGASTTEVEPDEMFAASGRMPTPTQPGGARQPVEPEPLKLRAADLKLVWQGEDLSRPEVQRLDFSNDTGGHELSESEIDARFRAKEDAVLGCIARARPDPYTEIPGRVTVRFRIQRTGTVKGVQVEAPVILHKGGLTGCLKGVMGGLKFPASSSSQVITYPFSLM
ncbi:MAG: hypothetical protein JWM82_2591 [Myxococcales bacterium]|nr:hypothetical protein [Myxococcales bacterium]